MQPMIRSLTLEFLTSKWTQVLFYVDLKIAPDDIIHLFLNIKKGFATIYFSRNMFIYIVIKDYVYISKSIFFGIVSVVLIMLNFTFILAKRVCTSSKLWLWSQWWCVHIIKNCYIKLIFRKAVIKITNVKKSF